MTESNENLNDRMRSLEKEMSHLHQKYYQLEKQLNELTPNTEDPFLKSHDEKLAEESLHSKSAKRGVEKRQVSEPLSDEKPPQLPTQADESVPTDHVSTESKPTEKPKKPVNHEQFFERLLSIWLPRIFMTILIFGVLWGLKVGIDNGWISYEARIVLGYASTIFIFYLGLKNIKKNQKLFGLTLISGVIAIGILVTTAAYYLYELLNYPIAMIISVVYIALGLIVSEKSKSETLTVFSGFAGFLLPFLIQGTTVNTWTFCLYLLILFITLFYIAISGKHKVSYYVTFFFFQLTLLVYTIIGLVPGDEMYIVLTALIQHLLFLLFYVNRAISRSIFTETTIYLNVTFMVGWVKLLEAQQDVPVYGVLAILYILFAIYGFTRKDMKLQSIFLAVSIFSISVFILSFNMESYESKMLLLLINTAIGIWIGLYFKSIRTIVISSFIYTMTGLSVISAVGIFSWLTIQHATWIAFIATMIFIFYSLYSLGIKQFHLKVKNIDFSLVIAQIVSLIYIFKLTNMVLDFKLEISDLSLYNHISLLVLLCAITISFFAYRWRRGLYISYVAVIELVLIGLFFVTSSLTMYTTGKPIFLFNLLTEIFYLLIFSLLFVMVAKGKFPGMNQLQKSTSLFAVMMQFIFFAFFNKWYFYSANVFVWENDYIFIGHTIWMFLFAFLSVSLGARFGWKIVQYLGITLIGICLLKLFFIDLINVSIVIRAILFIVVGVIGLVYSRIMLKGNHEESNEE